MSKLVLWLAEGCGSGRLRPAPGTWGSIVGAGWFLLVLVPGSALVFGLGTVVAALLAVWLCGEAERILGRHDPGSVVLDEIVAIPVCFVPLLVAQWHRTGSFPDAAHFLRAWPWWTVPAGFALFRLFDIWKPWPVRQVQRLPGGWGVVVDDLLAAGWVAVVAGLGLALVPGR